MALDPDRVDDLERKISDLKAGQTPRFVARSPEGPWEFSNEAPSLGSGPYVERMSNGVIRRWSNRTASDISYVDL
jgi:hypothetical protein